MCNVGSCVWGGSVLVSKNVNFKPNWLAMKALDYTIVYFISTEFFSVQSGQWAKTAKAGLTPLQSGERAHKAPCVMLTQAINYFLDKNNLRNCFGFSWSKDIECVVLGTGSIIFLLDGKQHKRTGEVSYVSLFSRSFSVQFKFVLRNNSSCFITWLLSIEIL